MKLAPLSEVYQTQRTDVDVKKPLGFKRTKDDSHIDHGEGAWGTVKDNPNDPFMVRKTSKIPKDRENFDSEKIDGYWAFIRGIQNNEKLKNNPFLPRIYGVKKLRDINGKVIMRADMEKLVESIDIDGELLLRYINGIVDMPQVEAVLNAMKNSEEVNVRRVLELFTGLLENATETKNYQRIKNKYLIEAIDYIHGLTTDYVLDLHEGNIMFRRGTTGIQLVITDPLSANMI